MLPREQSDPLAAQMAEMALHGPLLAWLRRAEQEELTNWQPERDMAAEVVGLYAARMECRDGFRRVVLYGEWTVDPAAVTFVPAVKGP